MSKVLFNTNGTGLWSNTTTTVTITDMTLGKATMFEGDTDKDMFGELRVYFDTDTWDTQKDGLIYTDRLFIKELRAFLNAHGLPGNDVDYSEQGMQGYIYVSLDVGHKFYKAWIKKFGIAKETMIDRI